MTEVDTLSAIVRTCDDAIVTKTLDGIITFWNPAAQRIFGYDPSEVVGRPITLLFPSDRLSEEEAFQQAIGRGERVEHFETVRVRKDGTLVDISVSLSPILDSDGRLVSIAKVARDISDRKRLEAERRAHEQLLQVTLRSIGDAVIATDNLGRITFLNAVAEALTGWTSAGAAGKRIEEVFRIVNEKTGRAAPDPVARVLQEGVIVGLANHTALVSRDGTRRPIDDSAAPIHDDEGNIFGVVLVFRDVTERRQAEVALERLAAIVKSSDDAIIGKLLSGRITSWNRGAERMFGYAAAEAVGQPITMLFPPERYQEETALLASVATGAPVEHFETERLTKDGRRIAVSVTLSPIRDEDGDIVGVSKIARDITERVRLARAESAARREAEQANRLKDEFLATLSHELRTPLTSIQGWTRMLRAGAIDASKTAYALEVIERNCRSQVQLITDLLDVSRITAGRISLEKRPLKVSDIVRAVVDRMRPSAAEKSLTIESDLGDADVSVIGDAERLQQAFANVVSNAIKFTDHGRVSVRVHGVDSRVGIVVEDTGIGIRAEDLPVIFERFRQADRSIARRHQGLGVGLWLVRQIVEAHGGRVEATSAGEGQGTSVTILLPVSAPPPAAEEAPPRVDGITQAGLQGHSVLVVDDDRDTRDLIAELLRHAGATVFTASSTAEALGTLVTKRPDVLVSDLGMPGEDGFQLIRHVRQNPDPRLRAIPAIAVTGYAASSVRDASMRSGFQRHLTKPIEPVDLVRVVIEVLQG